MLLLGLDRDQRERLLRASAGARACRRGRSPAGASRGGRIAMTRGRNDRAGSTVSISATISRFVARNPSSVDVVVDDVEQRPARAEPDDVARRALALVAAAHLHQRPLSSAVAHRRARLVEPRRRERAGIRVALGRVPVERPEPRLALERRVERQLRAARGRAGAAGPRAPARRRRGRRRGDRAPRARPRPPRAARGGRRPARARARSAPPTLLPAGSIGTASTRPIQISVTTPL